MSIVPESVPVCFAGSHRAGNIPAWARHWNATRATVAEVCAPGAIPGVVVVHWKNPGELEERSLQTRALAGRLGCVDMPVHLVFEFGGKGGHSASDLARVLKLFPNGSSRIEFAWSRDRLEETVMEAVAKYAVEQEERQALPDVLAEAREVIDAIRPLLAPSGRLSAAAIAATFGMREAALARLIGRSRQAVAKTPDAPALQDALRPFERIARLRAALSDDKFRAWLHRPNRELDQATPFTLIVDGRAGIVADLVEDMLLGTPT